MIVVDQNVALHTLRIVKVWIIKGVKVIKLTDHQISNKGANKTWEFEIN